MAEGLQALPTKEALQRLGEVFKEAIKKYGLVDTNDNVFYTRNILRTYFDDNGVLTVIFEIPVDENIETPAQGYVLLDENGNILVKGEFPTIIQFIKGFGGEIPVKIPISGEPATIVFKADSYITETEFKEIYKLEIRKDIDKKILFHNQDIEAHQDIRDMQQSLVLSVIQNTKSIFTNYLKTLQLEEKIMEVNK